MARPAKTPKQNPDFDQKMLDLRRVARVTGGGKRFSFRATVAIGNRKGKVGVGTEKGKDVASAMDKAVRQAKRSMTQINLSDGTIPHEVDFKYKSARVILRPAKVGTGVIAGGAVRIICDLAGIANVTGKIRSKSSNQINNARATIGALKGLKQARKKIQKEQTADVK